MSANLEAPIGRYLGKTGGEKFMGGKFFIFVAACQSNAKKAMPCAQDSANFLEFGKRCALSPMASSAQPAE